VIHNTAILENVHLGKNVKIGAYSVIKDCIIGDNTYIAPHVVIGEESEHSTNKYELNPRESNWIIIGKDTVIREFTSINKPIKDVTMIGDEVYIMGHSYIAHDCWIEDNAVISNGSLLGGWTRVMTYANLGLGTTCHQYTTIGSYAMIAANATIVKDVMPLCKYIPGKPLEINSYLVNKLKLPIHSENFQQEEFFIKLKTEWEEKRNKDRKIYK